MVEFAMKLAEKLSGADLRGGHFVHGGFHPLLRFDVGEVKLLKRAAFGIGRKFMRERRVNVTRHGAMAFDEVGVITVHRAHQPGDAAAGDRLQRPSQAFGAAEQFEAERGEPSVPVFRQQRLEVGGVVEQASRSHNFADNIADVAMNEKPLFTGHNLFYAGEQA